MSVGTNMFISGKLDKSFLYFVCAKLKFKLLSLNVTSAIMELPVYIHQTPDMILIFLTAPSSCKELYDKDR